MAKHEFGLMAVPPGVGQRYDEYEPEKYGCISVDDRYIETIAGASCAFESYCHTLDIPMKGLNYCGVTLIPPESLELFLQIIGACDGLEELKKLLLQAQRKNRYVIHYGL